MRQLAAARKPREGIRGAGVGRGEAVECPGEAAAVGGEDLVDCLDVRGGVVGRAERRGLLEDLLHYPRPVLLGQVVEEDPA